MKTIAVLKKDFHAGGGLEKASFRIIEKLQDFGEVMVFTASTAAVPCKVKSYNLQSRLKFKQLEEFDKWCQKTVKGFDIVLSLDRSSFQTHHRAGNGVHAAYLDLRSKTEGLLKKMSFTINPLHRIILKLEKSTFEDPYLRGIIVNSHLVKNQILEFYKTPAEKIHVVHNGVEWKELENSFQTSFSDRDKIAAFLKLDPSHYHFLFVGHNFKRKGLSEVLASLAKLKRKDFHLSVVGTDKNLSLYQQEVAELGLTSHVTFFGHQKFIYHFYQIADCLVIPSLYDPFANVTVEALAMGLFVISSKTNGGHEVLTPKTGIVLDNNLDLALETAFHHPKTRFTAKNIRDSVEHLDFSYQLEKVCQICIS